MKPRRLLTWLRTGLSDGYDGEDLWTWGSNSLATATLVLVACLVILSALSVWVQHLFGLWAD